MLMFPISIILNSPSYPLMFMFISISIFNIHICNHFENDGPHRDAGNVGDTKEEREYFVSHWISTMPKADRGNPGNLSDMRLYTIIPF